MVLATRPLPSTSPWNRTEASSYAPRLPPFLSYIAKPQESPLSPSARPGPRLPHTDREDKQIPRPGSQGAEFQVGPKFTKGSTFSSRFQTLQLGVWDRGNPGPSLPPFLGHVKRWPYIQETLTYNPKQPRPAWYPHPRRAPHRSCSK